MLLTIIYVQLEVKQILYVIILLIIISFLKYSHFKNSPPIFCLVLLLRLLPTLPHGKVHP